MFSISSNFVLNIISSLSKNTVIPSIKLFSSNSCFCFSVSTNVFITILLIPISSISSIIIDSSVSIFNLPSEYENSGIF